MKTMRANQGKLEPHKIEHLVHQLTGTVVLPDNADYDEGRKAWNLSFEQQPAIIVMAHSASDIAAAVAFAREVDLDIAVQATGHGVRRTAEDCMLINTSRMNVVRVDATAKTAWIEAGTKWGAVLEETQAYGLAPLLGSSPDVGAVGYTLGGGMGWLARKYGLSSDSVNRFEVVTAAGRILSASATENSDLFWGLRGGGGSLAIVTGMEVRLYPVTTIYGGNLIYPMERAQEVFKRYRSWLKRVPDDLTSSVLLINYPPLPEIPEFLRGQSFVQVRGCYCGPAEQGEALLKYWREWQSPLVDDFRIMPFSHVGAISADPIDPMPGFSTGAFLTAIDDEAIDTLIRRTFPASGPPPLIFTEIRHVGGMIATVDPDSSAYSHRQATLSFQTVGVTPSPESHRALTAYISRMKRDLQPVLTGGVYLNFLEGQESTDRTRDGYSPENYQRLSALKTVYDPENRLNRSFAIYPASTNADHAREAPFAPAVPGLEAMTPLGRPV